MVIQAAVVANKPDSRCDFELADMYVEFLRGHLSPEQRENVIDHVWICQRCQTEIRFLAAALTETTSAPSTEQCFSELKAYRVKYLDGEVPRRLLEQVEKHFSECPACQDQIGFLTALVQGTLLDWIKAPVAAS